MSQAFQPLTLVMTVRLAGSVVEANASTGPPVAHPVAWSRPVHPTSVGGEAVETGARTVLVLPGTSTFRRSRWRACLIGTHQRVDDLKDKVVRPRARDDHRGSVGHRSGVSNGLGGELPIAPTTLHSSSSLPPASRARKERQAGGES